MRAVRSLVVGLVILGVAAPAWADNITLSPGASINKPSANAAASSTSVSGAAASASSNPVQVNSQVNTQVNTQTTVQGQHQGQGQVQGQQQGQGQDQGQQQKQQANNDGNHQSVNVDVPRQAPPAIPAALAVSSLTCYGSWSIAASTPFGGVGAGFPTKDDDCERSRNALIFVNLGLRDVALALLGQNEDNAKAMADAGVKYPGQVAKVDTAIPDLRLNTPLGEPKEEKKSESTNFGTRASLTIHEALVANLAAQSAGAGM